MSVLKFENVEEEMKEEGREKEQKQTYQNEKQCFFLSKDIVFVCMYRRNVRTYTPLNSRS